MSDERKAEAGFAGVTCWATGAVIRMCGCGTDKQPVSPCLPVFTDGRSEWASCPTCKKTWDTRTLKEWPNSGMADHHSNKQIQLSPACDANDIPMSTS